MSPLTPAQIESALAACRSIRFAVVNASRHGGEFSLNDILAADRLAMAALAPAASVKPAAKPVAKRPLKKGGAS